MRGSQFLFIANAHIRPTAHETFQEEQAPSFLVCGQGWGNVELCVNSRRRCKRKKRMPRNQHTQLNRMFSAYGSNVLKTVHQPTSSHDSDQCSVQSRAAHTGYSSAALDMALVVWPWRSPPCTHPCLTTPPGKASLQGFMRIRHLAVFRKRR